MVPHKPSIFIKDAIFLSHTSLNDFTNCPRAYYLKNVYRDPEHGFRLQIASPNISLGAVVHDVAKWYLEDLDKPSLVSAEDKFRSLWWKFHGKRGGFASDEEEAVFGKRGLSMVANFIKNAGRLGKMAPFANFPKYPLSNKIILTGNMDFVGELPDGTLLVIDFKTGVKDEKDPIQLYIYAILSENYYQKPVTKASYWYLDREDTPREIILEPTEKTLDWLKEKGLQIQEAIEKNEWVCPEGESLCRHCRNYQAIIEGKGEFMFTDHAFKKEVYYLAPQALETPMEDSGDNATSANVL